ncbi:MAG: hypothetical protein ABIH39_05165 [Candidatus Margulisiibacteriota bacterium]
MTKVFIGGSRDITTLDQNIKNELDSIIKKNDTVIIGDANGADKAVQYYLNENKYKNVIVYCMKGNCRNNIGNWTTKYICSEYAKKDFNFFVTKDLEMAKDANYGLMIWDARSKGTINNILNLIENNKKALLYFKSEHKFYNINNVNDLQAILGKCDEKDINMFKKKLDLTHKLAALANVQQQLIAV